MSRKDVKHETGGVILYQPHVTAVQSNPGYWHGVSDLRGLAAYQTVEITTKKGNTLLFALNRHDNMVRVGAVQKTLSGTYPRDLHSEPLNGRNMDQVIESAQQKLRFEIAKMEVKK